MPSQDGPDVSEYQGYPDWDAFAAAYPDVLLVIAKMTQGQTYVDRAGRYNRDNLRRLVDAGWHDNRTVENLPVIGFYHFADQWNTDAQAAHFADVTGPLRPGEIVAVDAEPVKIGGVVYIPDLPVGHVCDLMDSIGARMGRTCVSYRGYYYPHSGDPRYANYPWWYPYYGVEQPPHDYGYGWVIHQYGGAPYVGITPGKDVDTNHVRDYAALVANAQFGAQPAPPTPGEEMAGSAVYQLPDRPTHWSLETGYLPAANSWRRDPDTSTMSPWGRDTDGPYWHHLSPNEEVERLKTGSLKGTRLLAAGDADLDADFVDWPHDDNAQ